MFSCLSGNRQRWKKVRSKRSTNYWRETYHSGTRLTQGFERMKGASRLIRCTALLQRHIAFAQDRAKLSPFICNQGVRLGKEGYAKQSVRVIRPRRHERGRHKTIGWVWIGWAATSVRLRVPATKNSSWVGCSLKMNVAAPYVYFRTRWGGFVCRSISQQNDVWAWAEISRLSKQLYNL